MFWYSEIAHEMDVMRELLKLDFVKEAKGTFGVYDIFVKIEANFSKEIEDIVTKQIRKRNMYCLLQHFR